MEPIQALTALHIVTPKFQSIVPMRAVSLYVYLPIRTVLPAFTLVPKLLLNVTTQYNVASINYQTHSMMVQVAYIGKYQVIQKSGR